MSQIKNASNNHRVFLGLHQPPLVSAARWLVKNFRTGGALAAGSLAKTSAAPGGKLQLDLSRFLVVLPTARAQQRLLQLLVAEADSQDLLLVPPRITTIGNLPEFLYVAEKQLATELAQQIAWSQALAESSVEEIRCLTGRTEVEGLQEWQPLANLISRLHSRLANDIWSFRSVANRVKDVPDFLHHEEERWDVLNTIQHRYYSILHEVDLWDKQAARNYAAAGLLKADPPEIRCATSRHVVMLGTADLNRSITEMLRQVASATPEKIHVLIAGEESQSHCFDDFGSLVTEEWLDTQLNIRDEQIQIVDQPADQADAVSIFLTNLSEDYATDEITVGIPDVSLAPQVGRSLNAISLKHRNLTGRPLAETAPVRLMIACRDFLTEQDYEAFAKLVRHPDLFRWLDVQVEKDDWLDDLDEYQNQFLPNLLAINNKQPFGSPSAIAKEFDETDPKSERRAQRQANAVGRLNSIHQLVAMLLRPLLGAEQNIANWSKPWGLILSTVYGDRVMNQTNPKDLQIIKACDAVYGALGNQQQIPAKFSMQTSASQALDWALRAAMEYRVVDPPIPDAIELAGWLDLALDDAPVMVITNVNDEHVPSSEVGHQFLPNELCKSLKILDNDRRYSRDAYAMNVISAVRKNLLLLVGRRDEKGEPKKPSRLLFTTDFETSAKRAKAFFGYKGKSVPRKWITLKEDFREEQQLPIPMPTHSEPFETVSVTKFKDFLACPYRFYLKHKLKLKKKQDDWRELSGGTFGDLTHAVVESFGQSELRDTTDADEILDFFNRRLDYFVKEKFFGSRLPAVQIQVEQLRQRLERFAVCQAEHRKQGWRIVSTEEHLFHRFMVDGAPFVINGKIDRVDQHEITKQVAVWDYKSSDAGTRPERAHYKPKAREWIDLQLPLYRHLVKEVQVVADADFSDIKLGYILLSKKLDEIGFSEVSWTEDVLRTADDMARQVVRRIRKGMFWPPKEKPPKFSEDFAGICQDDVFEQFQVYSADTEEERVPPW